MAILYRNNDVSGTYYAIVFGLWRYVPNENIEKIVQFCALWCIL